VVHIFCQNHEKSWFCHTWWWRLDAAYLIKYIFEPHNYCLCWAYYLVFQTLHWVFSREQRERKGKKDVAAHSWTKSSTRNLCSRVIFINFINKCMTLWHWKFLAAVYGFIFEEQSGKYGIWHGCSCMLSNKINKSKQAICLEVDGVNWNLEYESGIECNLW